MKVEGDKLVVEGVMDGSVNDRKSKVEMRSQFFFF